MSSPVFDHSLPVGPYEVPDLPKLNRRVAIPSHYYKTFALKQEGERYAKVIAFVVVNTDEFAKSVSADLGSVLASVDGVDKLSGLNFFPDLDSGFEARGAVVAGQLW